MRRLFLDFADDSARIVVSTSYVNTLVYAVRHSNVLLYTHLSLAPSLHG